MEEVRHLFFKMNSQHASAFLKFKEDEIPSSHFNLQLKHEGAGVIAQNRTHTKAPSALLPKGPHCRAEIIKFKIEHV